MRKGPSERIFTREYVFSVNSAFPDFLRPHTSSDALPSLIRGWIRVFGATCNFLQLVGLTFLQGVDIVATCFLPLY